MDRKTLLIWLNVGLLIVAWMMAFSSYNSLPDHIPTHFNFQGQPDAWGEKSPFMFFLLPATQTVIVVLMLILLRFPQYYNFPQKKEVRNWPEKFSRPVYDFLKHFILIVALLINVMFLIIQSMIISSAKAGEMNPYWKWCMIISALIWLPLLITFLVKINKLVTIQRKKIASMHTDR
jgi:uncharacterized membrane protein